MSDNKHCYTGLDECPHKPACVWDCERLYDQATRKIKPYPAVVPDDIEPVSDGWHTVGKLMIGAVLAMIVVCFTLVFFTGVWIWSLLI